MNTVEKRIIMEYRNYLQSTISALEKNTQSIHTQWKIYTEMLKNFDEIFKIENEKQVESNNIFNVENVQ